MKMRVDDHTLCKAGCGKPVLNSSGVCMPCRRIPCNRCGKPFVAKVPGILRCGECKRIVAKSDRGRIAG